MPPTVNLWLRTDFARDRIVSTAVKGSLLSTILVAREWTYEKDERTAHRLIRFIVILEVIHFCSLGPRTKPPQHGSQILEAIRAGVGLGLGPRLTFLMTGSPMGEKRKDRCQPTLGVACCSPIGMITIWWL